MAKAKLQLEKIHAENTTDTQNRDPQNSALIALEAAQLDNEHKKAIIDGLLQDTEQRKEFANTIFRFVNNWSKIALIILIASGLKVLDFSDAIILAIISGTTVNALGLLAIVTNYLFPKQNKK
jgi:hypothetical protein